MGVTVIEAVSLALSGSALAVSLAPCFRKSQEPFVVKTGGSAFYNGAQVKDGIIYCSGAIGITGKGPKGPIFAGTDVKSQTKQVLENLAAILAEAGSSMDKVMKCTCYLGDISMYSDFNEVYLQYFADPATRPARVCFAVQDLPFGALVECELTAYTM